VALWDRFFKSPELKATLAELASHNEHLLENPSASGGYAIAKPMITKALVEQSAAFTAKVRQEGISPRTALNRAIVGICGSEIASGRWHSYRGTLSMRGRALHSYWKWIIRNQEADGDRAPEDVVFALEEMQKQIKEAG
jgi:hypothetical protein